MMSLVCVTDRLLALAWLCYLQLICFGKWSAGVFEEAVVMYAGRSYGFELGAVAVRGASTGAYSWVR